MKRKLRLQILSLSFIFCGIGNVVAQVPFKQVPNSEMTIKGELKTIGNSIVGLNQDIDGAVFVPNDSYNGAGSNNHKTFGYIDVDNDNTTFSSSSADLLLNSNCGKIAYAGLYWAASYFVDRNPEDLDLIQYNDLPVIDNRPNFRTLKFKPPGSDYIVIPESSTEVIYDGYRNTPTNLNDVPAIDIPYACYTDVTSILQGLENPNGTYTIADMRASTGFSGYNSNGISGGWVLVVAYEDPTLSAKHISTSNGFLTVAPGDAKKEFIYEGFQTVPAPLQVNARYAIAALEGDQPFHGDTFQIKRTDGVAHDIFTAPVNPSNNFFDSSISIDGNHATQRNPASENTLGLDIDIFDIPNPNNTIIGNDQTSATFYATSNGDAFSVFFNSFQIEVLEPEVLVFEKVLDVNGIDISGEPVELGDQIFYELTIENKGTENIGNMSIKDILPVNVDLVANSIVTSDSGIVVDRNVSNSELTISIPDNLMLINGATQTIRFGVTVVPTCVDLRDACSNEIKNKLTYSFTGMTSGITSEEEPVSGQDVCKNDIPTVSNTLIQNGICFSETKSAMLCSSSLTLSAGSEFSEYEWVNLSDPGVVIGNTENITVTQPGTYRVTKTGNIDCRDAIETFVVISSTLSNPIVDIANNLGSNPSVNGNIRTCFITGDSLPELFLCGAGTTLNIPITFPVGTAVSWQRLDPAACPDVIREPNCPTSYIDSGSCNGDWVEVSTDANVYTVTQAGEYRMEVVFEGGCAVPFYFNVFQNNFDPQLVVSNEIICGNPGTLQVLNASNQYEFQLVSPSGMVTAYQVFPEFTGLTEVGPYTVNVRQIGGLPTACVFQDSIFLDEISSDVAVVSTPPFCVGEQGEISIDVRNSQINYTYSISNRTNSFTQTVGPVDQANHVFTGLEPDTYEVLVESANGLCADIYTVEVLPSGSVNVNLVSDLSCNPNYQPDETLNNPGHPNYDPTALPYDPDQFIAVYEVNVEGGSGNYAFNTQADFLGTTLVPTINTTYQFRTTVAGNHPVYVIDLENDCVIFAGSVETNPYMAPVASVTVINPTCLEDNGAIEVTTTSGEGPFVYTLDGATSIGPTSNNTITFNNVDPSKVYTIAITDKFGCSSTLIDGIVLTIPGEISATIDDKFKVLSCDVSVPNAQAQIASITGGSGNYEWSLSAVGPFISVVSLPFVIDFAIEGEYTLFIRDADTNTCLSSFPIVIDPLQDLEVIATVTSEPTCFSDVNGSLTLAVLGIDLTASTYSYEITGGTIFGSIISNSTTISPISIDGLGAGTYTVMITDDITNCTVFTDAVIESPLEINANVVTTNVSCNGSNDGTININVMGGTTSYLFSLFDNSNDTALYTFVEDSADDIIGEHLFDNLAPGSYRVEVEDSNGCPVSISDVFILEPVPFSVEYSQKIHGCNTIDEEALSEITLSIVGGTPPYSVSYESNVSSNEENNVLDIDIEKDGVQYSFYALTPGTYAISVTDANGCVFAPFEIQVPVFWMYDPFIEMTQSISCDNPERINLYIDGGIGPFDVEEVNGAVLSQSGITSGFPYASAIFELPNVGSYVFRITDTATGCTKDIPYDVDSFDTINATLVKISDTACNGGTTGQIELSVGGYFGVYNYVVSNSATGSIMTGTSNTTNGITVINSLSAGTYEVSVEAINAPFCDAISNTVIIEETSSLQVSVVEVTPESCYGNNTGTATLSISGGIPPYETSITNNNDGFVANKLTYDTLPGGENTVYVRDANGCTTAITVDVPYGVIWDASLTSRSDCAVIDPLTGEVVQEAIYYLDFIVNNDLPEDSIVYAVRGLNGTPDPENWNNNTTGTFIVQPGGEYEGIIEAYDCVDLVGEITIEESNTPLEVSIIGINPTDPGGDGEIIVKIEQNNDPYTLVLDNEITIPNVRGSYVFSNVAIGNHQVQVYGNSDCASKTVAVQIEVVDKNPIVAYADEILFCTITNQTYPVVEITNVEGEKLNVPYSNVASIVWQKLNEIDCDIELQYNCPTTDSNCSSDWFDVSTDETFTVLEDGRYRVIVTFANKSGSNTKIYYYRVKNNMPKINDEVVVFPNPGIDKVSINKEVRNVKVFNAVGKLVIETNKKNFSIIKLESGVYFARIETKDGHKEIIKLIKR